MIRDEWADSDAAMALDYDVLPADELCEDTPVEGGKHIKSMVSDRCIFCKREIES